MSITPLNTIIIVIIIMIEWNGTLCKITQAKTQNAFYPRLKSDSVCCTCAFFSSSYSDVCCCRRRCCSLSIEITSVVYEWTTKRRNDTFKHPQKCFPFFYMIENFHSLAFVTFFQLTHTHDSNFSCSVRLGSALFQEKCSQCVRCFFYFMRFQFFRGWMNYAVKFSSNWIQLSRIDLILRA